MSGFEGPVANRIWSVVRAASAVACLDCTASSLVEVDAQAGARVELCQSCKGMLVDECALERLTGARELEGMTELGDVAKLALCPRCNTACWRWRYVPSDADARVGWCATCGMTWFQAAGLSRFREAWLAARRREHRAAAAPARAEPQLELEQPGPLPVPSAPRGPAELSAAPTPALVAPPTDAGTSAEPAFNRSSFEHGALNVAAAPATLGLCLWIATGPLGAFFAALVAMPFHELGHALTSWLSSRIAVPLPFFTVWYDEQSLWFGLVLALGLGWLAYHSRRERTRFGLWLALGLLALQLGLSWLVPARLTRMLQIAGGALGELVLATLVIVGFHFPLPDRLRWDFWRWLALPPAALCLAHAWLTWLAARRDPARIPWGAAIGDQADGDMNRLVFDYGWTAQQLTAFYLRAGVSCALVIAGAYALAWRRTRRARG
ncbi:MAG TPA: hypothetical protein VNN80_33570 [Polyangiaceae bacterium]|nr:hypothetical protein [Polyangiaceae bacterium]